MGDIRKVIVELLVAARRSEWNDRTTDAIRSGESFLESLDADGGAWYPSSMDVSRRADAAYANRDNIIRAAIDEYRSRGGQVGGEVVYQARAIGRTIGAWFEVEPESHAAMVNNPNYETSELIARQPGAQAAHGSESISIKECPADIAAAYRANRFDLYQSEADKPAHGPVVGEAKVLAWRFVYSDNDGQWYPGAPTAGILEGARQAGSAIELAYSHPAAVPAEVMEAVNRLCTNYSCSSVEGECGVAIRDWLKSIQGAGHD